MKRTQVMSSLTMALAAAMLAIPAAPMGALAAPVTTGPRAGGPGASPLVRATERDLEVAAGPPVRSTPLVQAEAPSLAKLAWTQFLDRHGSWDAQWDTQSGVPVRIWGEGIATPGANADAARAEAAARQLLAEQLELLAPGTRTDDFKLTANVVHGGLHGGLPMRTVTFTQHVDGAPVIGAGVGFLFKNDRLFVISSSAVPRTSDRVPRAALADGVVAAGAEAWVTRATGIPARAIAAHAEVRWLPLYRTTGAVELAAVRSVTVAGTDPARPGRWDVYVDAGTGAPVARATLLRFATGTMTYRVPARSPQRPRIDAPVPFANFRIGATTVPSDGGGVVTWTGTSPVQVTTSLAGAKVAISNAAGALASATLTLAPGGSASWDRSTVANDDAQLATYIFVNTVKAYAKANLNPTMSYLDQQLSATVNESGSCNAYSTGDDIHFFPASNQCENTGRIADVVYHEFGHSLHAQSIIPGVGDFDGALSEGVSDYLAATITNDAGMGRGFFFNDSALRNLDPAVDLRYPDDLQGEPHADGEIIAGTLWDVRTAMIEAYGPAAGVTKADDIYYAIIQRASSIPTTYAEALAVDDDDGNLANGTPNLCLLRDVFARHGLATGSGATGSGLGAPVRAGFQIRVPIEPPVGACAAPTVGTATLSWKLRGGGGTTDVAMTRVGADLVGTIPAQADGAVVQYKLAVTVNGNPVRYPDNLADPLYEFFVGTIEPIYCTDFETDPQWTHGATAGSDNWQLGTPAGAGGDPRQAVSGTKVFGMNLTNGGTYAPDANVWARTPNITTTGYTNVRLQYRRWLNVEDGFFDHATIAADGATVWSNFNSNQGNNSSTSHTDREWRFHDVDLSSQAADGAVQLTFALQSDPGLELGGWTLDDVCVVGYRAGAVACGNNVVEPGEQCDDGNTASGDGCSATCQIEGPPPVDCGNGTVDPGEQCDDGNNTSGDGCSAACQTELAPPGCGDGTVTADEQCDDGNTTNGDGCSAVCVIEGPGADGDGGGCCSTGSGAGGPLTAAGLGLAMAAILRRRRR